MRAPDYGVLTGNSVTFGYEHLSDQADSKIDTVSGGYPYLSAVRAHDDTDSGYVGLQSTVSKRLALTGQLREDATTVAGSAFTWRFGGVLDLPEILSHVKASYGTGFRAPALYDRYGIDSYGYVGNPNLRPERSEGYEAGLVADLPLPARQSASIGVTYFSNRIRDLIQVQYAPDFLSSTPVNIASARTQGIETVLTYRVAPWVQADVTYTYTDARDLGARTQLLRRPYNQGSADLRLVPVAGVVIAPELLYVGNFQDYLTDDTGTPTPYVGRSPSGLIFNLNATWQRRAR